MNNKSPFFLVDEFISPLMCEDIIFRLNHIYPDVDLNDVPLKSIKYNALTEIRILPMLEELIPELENYFEFEYEGILPFKFEWFVEGFKVQPPSCESYTYTKTGWMRIKDIGFTGVIFLNDSNSNPPFDNDFEVYGGKLEFTNHQFGFNPKRGLLVVYPEAPNFINTTAPVKAGELNQIRFHIVPTIPYKYDMKHFPGNYKVWFKNL